MKLHENPKHWVQIVENALEKAYHESNELWEKIHSYYEKLYLNPDSPYKESIRLHGKKQLTTPHRRQEITMTDNKLYDLMKKQKGFILELIKQGRINEATASYETVKDLWCSGQYISGYAEINNELVSFQDKRISDARKSFAEEVRITGR